MTILCESCADKLRAQNNVTEEGELFAGRCPLHPWTGVTAVRRYEVTMKRKQYAPRANAGGGERARAGRR